MSVTGRSPGSHDVRHRPMRSSIDLQSSKKPSSCWRTCCCIFLPIAVIAGALMAVYFPDTHPPATLSFVANGFVVTPRQVELYGECDLLLTNRNAYDFEIRPSIIRVSHNGALLRELETGTEVFPAGQRTTMKIPVSVSANVATMDVAASILYNCQLVDNAPVRFDIDGVIFVTTWFLPFNVRIPLSTYRNIPCPPITGR
ncbi:hypothetical protein PBRA_005268 [Plasmodiophora brassicae]|uniref:Late embryogenesis abundant protein LEA-2 subgroup domain-containing protein n=1 Tax=Plasmodiophora brassicae TaxID=37360 RepID=A0A0G4INB2_PLABS|nr:hypothetical protein PBRA_005268 [Plasmodiophora brassicae]